MLISHATQTAPGVVRNEDGVVTGPGFAVVLDGATIAPGVDTGCIHDPPWLVARLAAELARLLLTESLSLPDTLERAIELVMAQHVDTCDLANPDSPSSTVAIVRDRGEVVDHLVLSDSPIVLRKPDGSIDVVHDDRNDFLPGYSVEVVRQQRNAPGGFWVASNNPDAAKEALTGSVARESLDCAGLFTDGASRLAERHDLEWADLMQLLDREGPTAVIDRVRRADELTAGRRLGKVHDDATAVLCRFDVALAMTADTPPMSTPRVASGALFHDEQGRTLLVKPTYKPRWDIPGGYVEPGETPREASRREVQEELALDRPLGRLLVIDWAPAADEGDKILFVFDGGRLGPEDIDRVVLPDRELARFRFFAEAELDEALIPRLSRRVRAALEAHRRQHAVYLENGTEPLR